ncbi:hypothetical protein [Polaromonas naphthalenivorans]|uniref:Transmembrane protein n=1 Tax=Polaromonas naphthalenivorans (strain CJ2) TaxID=365044 RepID=A1VRS2_POLNA|nr:hypothetical protein [Polaromonas naphthalenivorans]ABM38350.1 conserved hypothetical protein [Polaromonas naphthalenivorans CJ2]
MEIEFTRMGIVFMHLIACCVAIGLVVTSDIAMLKQLFRADPNERFDPHHLSDLQKTVSHSLLALWVTGAAIVTLDASLKGWGYFANPKLQSKVAIVMLLTMNGYALHKYVLPALQKAGSLLRLSFGQRRLALFTGAVSGVSWFYAAMLGIGRPLNWKYSLVQIMAAYPVLIAGGFACIALLTVWSQSRAGGANEEAREPRLASPH